MNISSIKKSALFASAISLIVFWLVPLAASADTNSGKLSLHITGLNNDKGVVRIALFNSKSTYSDSDASGQQAFKKDVSPIKDKSCDYTFEALPYGEYAIKIFHDEDNSGNFIRGAFGIPKVQYAFSNNAHGMMGPASYDKAKFTLNRQTMTMPIKMQGH